MAVWRKNYDLLLSSAKTANCWFRSECFGSHHWNLPRNHRFIHSSTTLERVASTGLHILSHRQNGTSSSWKAFRECLPFAMAANFPHSTWGNWHDILKLKIHHGGIWSRPGSLNIWLAMPYSAWFWRIIWRWRKDRCRGRHPTNHPQ